MEMTSLEGRFNDKEDIANALSHFAGAILSVAALVLMVVYSFLKGKERELQNLKICRYF